MRETPPLLLPLFRSNAVGELLAWLYLHPEKEYSTTDLARQAGVSQPTVSREMDRFAAAGLTKERRHGNLRLIRADTDTIVAKPLTDLLAVTFGPAAILPSLLQSIPGVNEAYIYGSWSPGTRTRPGHPRVTSTSSWWALRTRTNCTTRHGRRNASSAEK